MKNNKEPKQIFISEDEVNNRVCYCVVSIGKMGTGRAMTLKSILKESKNKS